jgi:ankyrin repeat protein
MIGTVKEGHKSSHNPSLTLRSESPTKNKIGELRVMRTSPHVMELILEHDGADVDLRNKEGQTPLLCAVRIEHPIAM